DALARSASLASLRGQALTGDELQEEVDRMVKDSKSPAVLRELFAALGDDPFLIAECLARPIVVDRKMAALNAGAPREEGLRWRIAEAAPARGTVDDTVLSPDLDAVQEPAGGYRVDLASLLAC